MKGGIVDLIERGLLPDKPQQNVFKAEEKGQKAEFCNLLVKYKVTKHPSIS